MFSIYAILCIIFLLLPPPPPIFVTFYISITNSTLAMLLTRHYDCLSFSIHCSSKFQTAFSYTAIKYFNMLPSSVKSFSSIFSFLSAVINLILTNKLQHNLLSYIQIFIIFLLLSTSFVLLSLLSFTFSYILYIFRCALKQQ